MHSASEYHWPHSPISQDNLRFLSYYLAIITLSMSVLSYAFMHVWHFQVPTRVLCLTLPVHMLLTGGTFLLAFKRVVVRESGCLTLLLVSVAIMGLFLYDTGGHTNPLISLLLLPLAMSAATLGWISTVLLALSGVGLYSILTRFYVGLEGQGGHAQHHVMHIHLIGMWMTYGISASMIVGLVTPMASSMRRQRELIAQQQEKILRDERLVALATFAASAAHQLGTPLSTLMVVTDDLKDCLQDRPDLAPDLDLMQQQIGLCKETLHAIMRRADHLRHGEPEPMLLGPWLIALRDQFNLLNPTKVLQLPSHPVPECQLIRDETLDQAMLNLLDNAARASSQDPALDVIVRPAQIVLRIIDSGPGVPDAIRSQLGQPFVSARDDGNGMGLGLFLSHATINRFGGQLSLHSTPQGTTTEIVLPRASSTGTRLSNATGEGAATAEAGATTAVTNKERDPD